MSTPKPQIQTSKAFDFFTSIWIVPFLALIIAAWLAYQYFAQRGLEIRIVFSNNEGLQAGQSQIKYRNVPVGKITKIELQEEGDGIVVVARMDKTVTPFLNDSTQFWIVKPEVSIGGVSGLDTLFSGTYINMHAKKALSSQQDTFIGQAHAYRDDSRGSYFVLNTPQGSNTVTVGTPVYLKNIKVGQVEYIVLSLDNSSVDVIVYIDNLYTPYLRVDSHFWVRSTVDASVNNGHVDFSIAPLTDLIQGAIEFSSQKKGLTCTVPDKHVFKLYANKGAVENTSLGNNKKQIETFKLSTQQSIAKLHIGAPVRYEGFEVGSVKEMKIHYNNTSHLMQSDILIAINLSVFANTDDVMSLTGKKNFFQAVKEGLRAQIVPSDPLTGFLYIDLRFNTQDDNRSMVYDKGFAVLPTTQAPSSDIMASMTHILDKINALPLATLLHSLTQMVDNTNGIITKADKPLTSLIQELNKSAKNLSKMTSKKSFDVLPNEVNKSLKTLTSTLKTTKKMLKGYSENSLIQAQLSHTLKSVTQTSKEMQFFLKMLNRKPNSLIFGDK